MRSVIGTAVLAFLLPSTAMAQTALASAGDPLPSETTTFSGTSTPDGSGSPLPPLGGERGAPAGEGLTLALGGSYARGDFGTASNTDIWSVPLVARYRTGGLQFSASLPWMSITSDGTLFTGIDATPLVVAPEIKSTRRHRRGIGDLTLGASYDVGQVTAAAVDLELSARVKVPTASDRSQLSTGKMDYALGAHASRQFGDLVPFASVTYRIFGDSGPWDLRNGVAASAGASYVVGGGATIVASYDYAERASGFVSDSHEMFGGISIPVARTPLRLTAYGTVGLSRGAPDASGGLSVTTSF